MSEIFGHSLRLQFDADGDFARGFEAGRFWTQLQDEEHRHELVGQPLHLTNIEMVLRMGESLDLTIAAEPQDDDCWMVVTAIEEATE